MAKTSRMIEFFNNGTQQEATDSSNQTNVTVMLSNIVISSTSRTGCI